MRALKASIGHTHMMTLPLDRIRVRDGFNVRPPGPEMDAHIESFRETIRSGGYVPPALIRWDGEVGWIIEGHCRFAAYTAEAAEGTEIAGMACVLAPQGTGDDDAVAIMLTAGQGLALPPSAHIEGIKRLMAYHWPKDRIAARLGKTSRQIDALLSLAEAPVILQEMVAQGKIAATEVNKAVRLNGSDGAVAVIREATEAARLAGSKKVRPRHIEAVKAPVARLSAEQRAIMRFLAPWDMLRAKPTLPQDVLDGIEAMRAVVP